MNQEHPSKNQADFFDPARAQLIEAALDLGWRTYAGDPLPVFFHQLYFWDPQTPDNLGRDGHPRVGGVIPDMGLARRMWAGGRLKFHEPLIAGQMGEKRTTCVATKHKVGRSGPLGFVTLRHDIYQAGRLCLSEWQDLVYRPDPIAVPSNQNPPNGPVKTPVRPASSTAARRDAEQIQHRVFDTTLLFRYSAATCNGHRIHYDQQYAQTTEGYTGLVVHGPLLAQCLMLIAEKSMGALGEFSFRAHSPVMHHEQVALCRAGRDLWVTGPDGRLCMSAVADPA
jgi:3-methylfumaryl-CoA hydratase